MKTCANCNIEIKYPRKKFCSSECERNNRSGYPKTRTCKACDTSFQVLTQADNNRRYCNKSCSKKAWTKQAKDWRDGNPEKLKAYAKTYTEKNPTLNAELKRQDRLERIDALGGGCTVCGVDKDYMLHLDYVPTCRDLQYRHSRGKRFFYDNIKDFRLLCANHHYELTITGQIEGTDITQ